jgi:IS5 family transposase
MSQLGFWDWQQRHEYLAEKKNTLVKLNELVPWSEFRPILEQIHQKERKSNAGRKAIDPIILFKMLLLQRLYSISDEQLEYQVNDRLSFMEFLSLGMEDKVPDGTTVWLFRQKITERGIGRELFEKFEEYLRGAGYEAEGGQIIDATLIPVPRQQNSQEEHESIKAGKVPEEWEKKPHKNAQKDKDARWTKKNQQSYFGYKNHINVDVKYKFVRQYEVSDASVHDSQMLGNVLDGKNKGDGLWADSAYRSEEREKVLKLMGFESHIHERGYRNKALSEAQKEENREKSRIRARVEHVFGTFVNTMGGKMERVRGKARIETQIALKNLAYNLRRYVFLESRCV